MVPAKINLMFLTHSSWEFGSSAHCFGMMLFKRIGMLRSVTIPMNVTLQKSVADCLGYLSDKAVLLINVVGCSYSTTMTMLLVKWVSSTSWTSSARSGELQGDFESFVGVVVVSPGCCSSQSPDWSCSQPTALINWITGRTIFATYCSGWCWCRENPW